MAAAGGIAGLGWWRKALTWDGALAATTVGTATFHGGGLPMASAMVCFFATSSVLSRRRPQAGEQAATKGSRRDAIQVAANGGVAALACLGGQPLRGAALGAIAAAAADTWATEIGVRSSTPPRSIVSGRALAPGESGGVTPLGWAASAAGAAAVGLAAGLAARRGVRAALAIALPAGLIGCAVDSLLGATLQAVYRCDACDARTESSSHACGRIARLERGLPWVDNDLVNLAATATGGLVGLLVSRCRR
ncbi:MAG: DUF92 domain-containing protein [Chloroflexota bacterium]